MIKKFLLNHLGAVLFVLLTSFISLGLITLIDKGKRVNELVILLDNTEYKCTKVTPSNDGTTTLVLLDKNVIIVPTVRIKVIKVIN